MLSDHLRDDIFRRYRNHHVNVILHQMPFFRSPFLLRLKLAETLPEVLPLFPLQNLPPILGNENDVISALPFAVA